MEEKTISPLENREPSIITIPTSEVLPSLIAYTLVEESEKILSSDVSFENPVSEDHTAKILPGKKIAENVSFTELINSYCSDSKTNETEDLQNLLNSWKIPVHHHQYFIDENLFVPVLKVADPFFMKRFLNTLNITTASRIVFFDMWQQWKIGLSSAISYETLIGDISASKNTSTPTTSHSSPIPSNCSKKLVDILNCSDGETIKNYYKNNKNIDNKVVRSLLVNTIVNYSITNNLHFSTKDLIQLADEIHTTFDEDPLDYFYLKKGAKNAKGTLANKFHNIRGKYRYINQVCLSDSIKKTKFEAESSVDANKLCMKMRHDFLTMNAQEKKSAWENTFNIRQIDLKNANRKSITWNEFYEKWHFISFSNGFEYIESDFNEMFGNKDSVLAGTRMTDFCNLMLKNVFPELIADTEVRNKLQDFNLKCLSDPHSSTISKNSRVAMVLIHLHYLLPPSGREINKRFTVADSQEASIRVFAQPQDYKEYQNALAASQSQPPVITIIGSIEKVEEIHVDFDNCHFKLFTFERAVDVCLKTFFTFNIAYPKPCESFWEFIDVYFYQINKAATNSKVRSLLKFLKSAENGNMQVNNP